MKRLAEILKAQKLDEGQIAAVTAAMEKAPLYVTGEANIDERYSKLKDDSTATEGRLTEANGLIAQLKKDLEKDADAQAKIDAYEKKIADLEAEVIQVRTEAELQSALRDGGAEPDSVDYLIFKIKEEGEVTLGKNGKIAGIEDTIKELKTKYAAQFAGDGEGDSTGKVYDPKKLKEGEEKPAAVSKEDFQKMGYKARLEMKKKDPEGYKSLKGDTSE
jgi:hypothetical protein